MAHLVGVASTEAFKEALVGHRPSDFLENAKSVVVLAMVIPLSIVKTIPSIHYSLCYRYLNEQLRLLAYRVAIFIESHGFEALPLDPSEPDYAREVRILEGKPGLKVEILGSFSHRHAAVLAGLGEISAASYVVVPKFGPRIRLTSVITTACLEPDSMFRNDFK